MGVDLCKRLYKHFLRSQGCGERTLSASASDMQSTLTMKSGSPCSPRHAPFSISDHHEPMRLTDPDTICTRSRPKPDTVCTRKYSNQSTAPDISSDHVSDMQSTLTMKSGSPCGHIRAIPPSVLHRRERDNTFRALRHSTGYDRQRARNLLSLSRRHSNTFGVTGLLFINTDICAYIDTNTLHIHIYTHIYIINHTHIYIYICMRRSLLPPPHRTWRAL